MRKLLIGLTVKTVALLLVSFSVLAGTTVKYGYLKVPIFNSPECVGRTFDIILENAGNGNFRKNSKNRLLHVYST